MLCPLCASICLLQQQGKHEASSNIPKLETLHVFLLDLVRPDSRLLRTPRLSSQLWQFNITADNFGFRGMRSRGRPYAKEVGSQIQGQVWNFRFASGIFSLLSPVSAVASWLVYGQEGAVFSWNNFYSTVSDSGGGTDGENARNPCTPCLALVHYLTDVSEQKETRCVFTSTERDRTPCPPRQFDS